MCIAVNMVLISMCNCMYVLINSVVARIGFLDTSYDVNEADGTVDFRIGVIEGNLAVPVTINFATSDGSAISKCMHGDQKRKAI